MAVYALRYLWEHSGGESSDRLVWTFHVDAPAAPSATDAELSFVGAWNVPGGQVGDMQSAYTLDMVQVYDVAVGGPPVDQLITEGANRVTPTGGAAPHEIQLCITRWMLDGLGRNIKKGRWYFGPVASFRVQAARPIAAFRQNVLDFQEALHLNYEAQGWTPVIDTKGALHVGETISQYSADDAWDTQRRRGLDPTSEIILVPGA